MLAPFHIKTYQGGKGALRGAEVFEPGFRVIEDRKQRKQMSRGSVAANMFIERSADSGVPRDALLEADLSLWYRAAVARPEPDRWYPRTLEYLGYTERLPLFERGCNPEFFDSLASVLGVANRADFSKRFNELEEDHFYPIGRSLTGRQSYAQQLGIEPS